MKKSCKYCNSIHDKGYVCDKKPQIKYHQKRDSREDKFRSSYDWQKKREYILKRDRYLCQACLAGLNGTLSRLTTAGLSVHHIRSLKTNFDLRLDDGNLITLCNIHHEMAEKGCISANVLLKLIPPTSQN